MVRLVRFERESLTRLAGTDRSSGTFSFANNPGNQCFKRANCASVIIATKRGEASATERSTASLDVLGVGGEE